RAVVIDLVYHRVARTDVIGHIFRIGRARNASRQVQTGNVETDAVTVAEQIGGRQNLDLILFDYTRRDRFASFSRQRMPGPPGCRPHGIERPVRSADPTTGELAL